MNFVCYLYVCVAKRIEEKRSVLERGEELFFAVEVLR